MGFPLQSFQNRVVQIELFGHVLIEKSETHFVPELDLPFERRKSSCETLEKRAFSCAVKADYREMIATRQLQANVVQNDFLAITQAHSIESQNQFAGSSGSGNPYLRGYRKGLDLNGFHSIQSLESRLRLACFRRLSAKARDEIEDFFSLGLERERASLELRSQKLLLLEVAVDVSVEFGDVTPLNLEDMIR